VAAAVYGKITDPRKLGDYPQVKEPKRYLFNENLIIKPLPVKKRHTIEVIKGPNIAPFPGLQPLPEHYEGEVVLKVGDNITTDHIVPAGSRIMSLRSNLPAISEFCFEALDTGFAARARAAGGGILVGGENYGQGSSREHAALSPRFLGVRAVIVLSYARIHRQNLVNAGILPLIFCHAGDYAKVSQGDRLSIRGVLAGLAADSFSVKNETTGAVFSARHGLSGRQVDLLLAGGALNAARRELSGR